MTATSPSQAGKLVDAAGVLGRWLLGGLFLYAGWNKTEDPAAFLKLVRQYGLLDTPLLLNLTAVALPWCEVLCGLLLVAGVGVRGAALVLLGLLAPFTAIVFDRAWGLHGALGIPFCQVKFDCGCGLGEVFICAKLVENTVSAALAAWLVAGAGQRLCLRHELVPGPPRAERNP